MSRFSGAQGKGARARAKATRRREAVARQTINVERGYYLSKGVLIGGPVAPISEFLPKGESL